MSFYVMSAKCKESGKRFRIDEKMPILSKSYSIIAIIAIIMICSWNMRISPKSIHNFVEIFCTQTHRPLQKHNPLGGVNDYLPMIRVEDDDPVTTTSLLHKCKQPVLLYSSPASCSSSTEQLHRRLAPSILPVWRRCWWSTLVFFSLIKKLIAW